VPIITEELQKYFQKPRNILIIRNMQQSRREGLHVHVFLSLMIYKNKMDFQLFFYSKNKSSTPCFCYASLD